MTTEIADYVKGCTPCQANKPNTQARCAPLHVHDIPPHPWDTISMDIIRPLPKSKGYDAILVIVDWFSKRIILEPITTTLTSQGLAQIFIQWLFWNFGLPKKIISDRGSIFTSQFIKELYAMLDIKGNPSTAYHPQTDGQTERINQEVEIYLRFYLNYQQDNWSQQLPLAEFAYNDHQHSSTGHSPFTLTNGTNPYKGFELT
jgi:transposase InsO family protein